MDLSFSVVLLIAGILIITSIITSQIFAKFGLSSLLVTLCIGLMLGNGGAFDFNYDFPTTTLKISEIALCFIIFFGGFNSKLSAMKPVIRPGLTMATLGVVITALSLGVLLHFILGWDWLKCFLMGAIVSSTDAAAVFSVLEQSQVKLKAGMKEVLELESGTNDPMAWFLAISFTTMIIAPDEMNVWLMILSFFKTMGLGIISGIVLGKLLHLIIRKAELKKGQNPVMLLALVLILYSLNTLIGGSALIAVYVAGIYLGNSSWVFREINIHFFQGFSWLMETVLFLLLGMQIFPRALLDDAGIAIVVALLLMFISRPLGVFASLAFFKKRSMAKGVFLSWVGLRGATPIVFALIPVVYQVVGAQQLLHVTFIVVVVSILFQGSGLGFVARITGQQINPPAD